MWDFVWMFFWRLPQYLWTVRKFLFFSICHICVKCVFSHVTVFFWRSILFVKGMCFIFHLPYLHEQCSFPCYCVLLEVCSLFAKRFSICHICMNCVLSHVTVCFWRSIHYLLKVFHSLFGNCVVFHITVLIFTVC